MRIVVIGAGIVGAAIAFHLARRGASVSLLDAAEPGMGASNHSFAWINAFGKEPRAYNELNRRSLDTWDRFARLLDADIGLRWGGHITWAATDEDAANLVAQVERLQTWGYVARLLDESEMTRLEPGLSPGRVAAAAIAENDGHVPATLAAQAAARRVSEMGGKVMPNTPATGVETQDGRVASVQTPSGSLDCDAVVLAAGTATTEIADWLGVNVPQQTSPGVVVRTDPRPPILETVSIVYAPAADGVGQEIHVRQDADGMVVIGEGSQESLARDDSQNHADDLLARATHYLPALDGAKAVPVPVGYRPMPLDEMPVVGFAQAAPNLYIAFMHSGVTLAPLIGELAALEILDGARVDLLDPYRPERFA